MSYNKKPYIVTPESWGLINYKCKKLAKENSDAIYELSKVEYMFILACTELSKVTGVPVEELITKFETEVEKDGK